MYKTIQECRYTNIYTCVLIYLWTSQVAIVVKKLPANSGDVRNAGSIPALEKSPVVGNSDPLQYSCLGNFMDRES